MTQFFDLCISEGKGQKCWGFSHRAYKGRLPYITFAHEAGALGHCDILLEFRSAEMLSAPSRRFLEQTACLENAGYPPDLP